MEEGMRETGVLPHRTGREGLDDELRCKAGWGCAKMAAELVRRGADPNSADARGMTTWHYVAASVGDGGEWDVAKRASEDEVGEDGEPLPPAVPSGKRPGEVSAAVLEALAEVVPRETLDADQADKEGRRPLHLAAANGRAVTLRLLHDLGADLESKTEMGRTALHEAAANGRDAAVSVLLELGADVNATDAVGYTPLHLATLQAKKAQDEDPTVRILTAAGADTTPHTLCGWTADRIRMAGKGEM